MIVIADASGLIAASDRRSVDHEGCKRVLGDAGTVIVSPLVLAEFDHLVKARFGAAARRALTAAVVAQVASTRFEVPHIARGVLETAVAVQLRYADLDVDLADAVNVAIAAEYRTSAVLTLDRRNFRAMRPLTPHPAFRVLPDDL